MKWTKKIADVCIFLFSAVVALSIAAAFCLIANWMAPANTYALYSCLASSLMLFIPLRASFLRPHARLLYAAWILLVTVFWAWPTERNNFAFRFNTVQPGMTARDVEQRLAPYQKRSEQSRSHGYGFGSSAPVTPRYTGTMGYTWTPEGTDEWGVIYLKNGIVESAYWYIMD